MKYPQVQIIIDILSRIDNSSRSKLGFDMNSGSKHERTQHECGSACCIGGWANRAMMLLEDRKTGCYGLETALSKLTNIPREDALRICYPDGFDWDSITLKVALKLLRKYRNTGEINWRSAGAKRYY